MQPMYSMFMRLQGVCPVSADPETFLNCSPIDMSPGFEWYVHYITTCIAVPCYHVEMLVWHS